MKKISILIPAYNIAHLLPRCLESILSQNTDNIEIVIVDDGSTDKTLECINDYAAQWKCIRAFSKKNEGVGAARNFLLDKALGEFIWFVDADDYVVDGCLDTILLELDNSVDTLVVAYNDAPLLSFVGSGIEYIKKRHINGYLWSKIIRRSTIEDAHVRFEPARYSQEDWFFLMQIYPLLKEVKQIPLKAYCYSDDNNSSVMRSAGMGHKRKLVADSRETICNFKSLLDGIKQESYADDYAQWMNFSAAGYLYSLFPLDYSIEDVKRDLNIFREKGIYPVSNTGIRKFNLFLSVVNHEWLYILAIRLYRLFRKK
ncbi:glycosyltransferase family 2 protein [Prevotella melaninogenica]|uniref:glycosyltransferase family 2 protein n=1 Tax=Prevotella melaninogenica TaxID=28132 RepID=UPI001BAA5261|nr:glycosyltransferase family A protein [Prevotella melaninogenica]QUB62025.1 glycosyltransferase family 2 protein [Prevotella melaninogenica]